MKKRNDLKGQEKRIIQKEESLDKKLEAIEKKEESFIHRDEEIAQRLKDIDATRDRVNELKQNIINETEKNCQHDQRRSQADAYRADG